MIEYFRLTIEYLRSALGGSIYKKTYQKNDGEIRLRRTINIHYSIFNNQFLVKVVKY